LLRGLTRSGAHWGGFVAEFEAALGVRVQTLDLPGNGRLWQERSPATVAGMVQHCRAQWQQLGISGPVSVLAMSLGGMVAAEWALQQPGEIRELVLMNTSMRPFNPAWQRLRPASLASLLMLAVRAAGAQAWEREILRLTTRHPRHDVLADWCVERLRHPVSGGNVLRQLLAAARYRAPMQGPTLPALVLSGAGDQLVSPQCSKSLAGQWHTSLQVHATAGHDLTLDAGPWVVEQVRRWKTPA
jgi:pimeloyl-ACP methyl ester carboxylesterase